MFELVQVSQRCFYFQSPAKIGLVRISPDEVVLIDSGNDKDAGRKVYQTLCAQGFKLRAIYNTHSHADHIGGNAFLSEKTGCKIYAPADECAFVRRTLFEPALLYGGNPPETLRHKFMMAKESEALPLTEEALPDGFSAERLPGHTISMTGYRTPDDVVFLGDCLSGHETLEKYKICYLFDPAAYLETLERVRSMKAKMFIPSHALPTEDIAPLVQENIDAVYAVADRISACCAERLTFESLLKRLFEAFGFAMTFEQYALVGSTVRSYLSWMLKLGRLSAEFDGGMLYYCALQR